MDDQFLSQQNEIVDAVIYAVRDARRQGIEASAFRAHPETVYVITTLAMTYPFIDARESMTTLGGLPLIADDNLAPGEIVIDPMKADSQAEKDFDALRQFAGELVADALGWPGVVTVRAKIMLTATWESPGGAVVIALADRRQWEISFTLRAITETPNLITVFRQQFDEVQREQAAEVVDGQ